MLTHHTFTYFIRYAFRWLHVALLPHRVVVITATSHLHKKWYKEMKTNVSNTGGKVIPFKSKLSVLGFCNVSAVGCRNKKNNHSCGLICKINRLQIPTDFHLTKLHPRKEQNYCSFSTLHPWRHEHKQAAQFATFLQRKEVPPPTSKYPCAIKQIYYLIAALISIISFGQSGVAFFPLTNKSVAMENKDARFFCREEFLNRKSWIYSWTWTSKGCRCF